MRSVRKLLSLRKSHPTTPSHLIIPYKSTPPDSDSPMTKGRSRETCTECSLRRQKCDRQRPCGRCVKRGIPDKCQLHWSGEYDPALHRVYPSTRPRSKQQSLTSDTPGRQSTIHGDSDNESTLLEGLHAHAAHFEAQQMRWANEPRLQYTFKPHNPPQIRRGAAASRSVQQPWLPPGVFGFNSTADAQAAFLQMLLPNVDHIWSLVNYHELALLWYHGCYHGPTLRWELQSVIAGQEQEETLIIKDLDMQWLALLFAIMAGSITCAPKRTLERWGFSRQEVVKLSLQWYKASISCLNQAEYTSNHSIYSVHAIATLTMSAHPLGQSAELSVLLGAALKIAQSLGLDRLDHNTTLEKITSTSSEEQRHKLLNREIGRRLWSQLCVQDWMSLPFHDSNNIKPLHFTTTKPSSRDHLTMNPIPPTFPTYISYGNYLFEIAKLMVSHHDAMLGATTQFTRYEHVLEYDARMRTLATQGMPRYFHVVEPIDPSWPEWVPWARRSLTICFAHKIIMIHRAFIRQSFINPAYSITRMTCLAAAKTILNEAKQIKDLDGPTIWIDKAFCVAAAVILCLDIFHRPESDAEYNSHKTLVTDCIDLLQTFDTSIVAVRGSSLLSALIADRDRLRSNLTWPPESIKTSDVFKSLMTGTNSPTGPEVQDEARPLPDLFPPQVGFCNRFLLEDLLSFNRSS
ncbi:hypothetical protein EDD36DRAFT_66452 [Exophiala viscosa]|uniref:Zn(2)-C6 fungal-type domain-containing protein n=2 Tax=Exophiala viscosa TaxID=2486360 RepID=A0AAN6DPT8_9EURO|nr:hypothetical protein EDD36DRAFT_66452 [Exophiala viscosa]